MKLKIFNCNIDFDKEIIKRTKIIKRSGYGNDQFCEMKINKYNSIRKIKTDHLNFVITQINIFKINIGEVINIRRVEKICCTDPEHCNQYYLVTKINSQYIEMENYATIHKAVKSQRIISKTDGYDLTTNFTAYKYL